MKIYSDDVVTKDDLKEVDVTQTQDIAKLRLYVIAGFVLNFLFTTTVGGVIWYLHSGVYK